MPEFGVRLPVVGPLAHRDSLQAAARICEEFGFDAVWVQDVICWSRHQNRHHISSGSREALEAAGDPPPVFLEALTTLGFLAGVTERVRIGVAVLCLPYRNPVVMAKEIANIDFLSGGRLILGVGVGAPRAISNVDFEVLGVPRKTKYQRTRDYLKAMVAIWTEDEASYEGEYVSFPPAPIHPKPLQQPHPPIWYGGSGPTGMDLAAEMATGWIPAWISPEEYPGRIEQLSDRARAVGRGGTDFEIATEIYVSLAETSEEALSNARGTLDVLPEGYGKERAPMPAILGASLIGSPDEVAEKVARYVEAGVDHFEMKFVYHTLDHLFQQLELFHHRVLPQFRSSGSAGES